MSTDLTPSQIKKMLHLDPHPIEGGWFRQTFASARTAKTQRGPRPNSTAIYYLLEEGAFSEMHQLASDEVFHFYLGDAVEMLQLWPDGSSRVVRMGPDLAAGEELQVVVPAGVWQGTRLLEGGQVALLGCTVAPGFDYADYARASCKELAERWPEQAERIRALTRF